MNHGFQHFRYNYNRRPVIYQGVNLWSFKWRPVGISTDLVTLEPSRVIAAPIYEIRVNGKSQFFAAIEILPDYWLFAAKDDPFDATGTPASIEPEPPRRSVYRPIPECMEGFMTSE